MTDSVIETEISSPDLVQSEMQNLSTREILEQNWDRLVEGTENQNPPLEAETLVQEQPLEPQPTTVADMVETAFEGLKETLVKKGVSSKEEWIKSLIEMDKIYHENPERLLKELNKEHLERQKNDPAFIQKQQRLNELLLNHALKDIQKTYAPYPALLSQPTGVYPKNEPFKPSVPKEISDPLAPKVFERGQETYPTKPSTAEINALVKEALSAYIAENRLATQKAKEASFHLKSSAVPKPTDNGRTPSGRLKTTREILEEGWSRFVGS